MPTFVLYAPSAASKKLKVKPGLPKFALMRRFLETFTDAGAPVRMIIPRVWDEKAEGWTWAPGVDPKWAGRVLALLGPGKTDHGFWTWLSTAAVLPEPRASILPELEALVAEAPEVDLRFEFLFCWVDPKTRKVLPGQRSEGLKHLHDLFMPVYGPWLRSKLEFTTISPSIGCIGQFVLPFSSPEDPGLRELVRAVEGVLGPYFTPSGFVVFDADTGKSRRLKL